ncbi:MAG TPA: ROK family protein [Vicinamibacterales bacterium]|nr:ROK family protein [Vicinamibacterales bacterium]HOG28378.1 ROK family protein [Vicinamibacterales bacterium]HOQ59815.1 ROK family protein [Vicinamibacterales bacterium]HPK71102.1 ROK family protein [Vicinamibacterales bacterium]HPW20130.1 ROK family protein [Vicinamibacterales bacterium]
MQPQAEVQQGAAVIALDLGGTKLASAMFVGDGRPRLVRVREIGRRQGAGVASLVCGEIRRLQHAAQQRGLQVRAVGVSVPGIAGPRTGRVWAPNIAGWADYPLRDEIAALPETQGAPVVVDSDRAACILGEAWQGAARGCRDAIFLAVGTGIGAGILAGGRVLRGASGSAGSAGWLALGRSFRREFAACGDFEWRASGRGLAASAARTAARTAGYRGPLSKASGLTARDVFAAFDADDPVAAAVIRSAVRSWGVACASLVSLFAPETIVFGGGVFGPAVRWLEAIRAEAARWAQPIAMRRVKFEASRLGPLAALYGAGWLARRAASGRRRPG